MGGGFWFGVVGGVLVLAVAVFIVVTATSNTCHRIQLQALHAGHPEIAEWIKGSEACQ